MNAQVQKLEALLARVQQNRIQSRTAPAAESIATAKQTIGEPSKRALEPAPLTRSESTQSKAQASFVQPIQPAEAAVPHPEQAQIEQTSPAEEASSAQHSAQKKTGTPLEAAVESHVESVVSPILEPELEVEAPVVEEVAADSARPKRIPMKPIAKPDKAVIEVVSKHPLIQDMTFGVLLKRTLSLRPR